MPTTKHALAVAKALDLEDLLQTTVDITRDGPLVPNPNPDPDPTRLIDRAVGPISA